MIARAADHGDDFFGCDLVAHGAIDGPGFHGFDLKCVISGRGGNLPAFHFQICAHTQNHISGDAPRANESRHIHDERIGLRAIRRRPCQMNHERA